MAEPCELKIKRRHQEPQAEALDQAKPGLDEETAVMEASRCLGNNFCRSCDLCRYFCPDLCITRNEQTGHIEIDYDYCKGCGICAFICPKGAITMAREE
ncbi:MAG: 4Fe-4S binding protein [Desulfobacterota bacterium]|nr:4Fe-4S binding protein [Thermodesulfobacteriota bacterium]